MSSQNSCARISGLVTLFVTAVVIVSGSICMIWSRVGMANIEIFGAKDLALLNKCVTQAGNSQPHPYACDSDTSFMCSSSDNSADYTICGVPPSCLCIVNSTDNPYVSTAHASSIADLIQLLFLYTGWLNFAAGASAIIGVLPVLVGAIGKLTGNEGLANACGGTGIAFEICCGLVTTWTLAGCALALAQIGSVFGMEVWQSGLNLHNTTGIASLPGSVPNTCPGSCQAATFSIRNEWLEYARNATIAAGWPFSLRVYRS